jgi:hypothetical protein
VTLKVWSVDIIRICKEHSLDPISERPLLLTRQILKKLHTYSRICLKKSRPYFWATSVNYQKTGERKRSPERQKFSQSGHPGHQADVRFGLSCCLVAPPKSRLVSAECDSIANRVSKYRSLDHLYFGCGPLEKVESARTNRASEHHLDFVQNCACPEMTAVGAFLQRR